MADNYATLAALESLRHRVAAEHPTRIEFHEVAEKVAAHETKIETLGVTLSHLHAAVSAIQNDLRRVVWIVLTGVLGTILTLVIKL
jgi:hypothetical protein